MGETKAPSVRTSELKPTDAQQTQNMYDEIRDDSHINDPYYDGKSIPPGKQGTQGDQMKFSNNNDFGGFGGAYEANNTETRALLNIEQSRFEIYLQRLYLSPRCQYFYLMLMLISILLVVVTLVQGYQVDENFYFILVEVILNIIVLVDFIFRVKLMGTKRFFQGGFWNLFDAFVVIGCIFIFLLMLLSQSGVLLILEELSEELLLISWSIFQMFRMVFIAKKQKLAQQSAKTLIDFTNVMESEGGDHSMRQGYDEVIVFDMKQMEQKQRQQNQLIGGSGLSQRKRSRGNSSKMQRTNEYNNHQNTYANEEIEMKDLGQNEKYQKQGLGGYEDEESLDNSGRLE